MGKSGVAASLALETVPAKVITVHRRCHARTLDTIVEEHPVSHLELDVTDSFSNMGLNWGGSDQAHHAHERFASTYMIFSQ